MELPWETCLRYSSTDVSEAIRPSGPGTFSVMEQTVHFSVTPANTRGRRVVVIAMLFAWLAWLLTCPNVMDEATSLMPVGGKHISQAAADSMPGAAHDDACCTAAPHSAVLTVAQKFNLTTYFILIFVLPVMVTSLTALAVAVSNRDFRRSSRSGWTKNSPLFCTLWPQAPPR